MTGLLGRAIVRSMTVEEFQKLFDSESSEGAELEDEFLKFERIESPLHPCPDICGFMLLDKLCPTYWRSAEWKSKRQGIVSGAGHDQIWLATDVEKLAEACTKEDVRTLLRCGIMYDSDSDSMTMFV